MELSEKDNGMQLTILDRGYKEFEDQISWINIPVGTSSLRIYPHHSDLISSVSRGQVTVMRSDGGKVRFIVKSGYLYVRDHQVHLLVGG